MTGQVLDRNPAGALILIIPVAFAIVVICQLWPVLLALATLIVSWKFWEDRQWRKWCAEVNPYFNNLVKESRGYLTPIDLSVNANITAKAAKVFLARKSAEYGTEPQQIEDKGLVYYFPTASALGRIFDDSEPYDNLEPESGITAKELGRIFDESDPNNSKSSQVIETPSVSKATNTVSFKEITQLAKQNVAHSSDSSQAISQAIALKLNQADLAKRLDVNSSTVGRQKNKPESDFAMWSQSRDPEGTVWKYLEQSNEFVSVDS